MALAFFAVLNYFVQPRISLSFSSLVSQLFMAGLLFYFAKKGRDKMKQNH